MIQNSKNTVLILLSSYNGGKYIREQLDSLLNQTVPVYILIRDDGSTDHTIEIIEEYLNNHSNISLIRGKNLGFVGSFNALMCDERASHYEWIAFCDQDDVWLPDKLEKAINKLSEIYESNKPTLYYSNLLNCTSDLKKSSKRFKRIPHSTKKNAIVDNPASGCASVFNHIALIRYKDGIKNRIIAHDWQMYCICKFMGNVLYEHEPSILYRQHGNNTIGAGTKSFKNGFIDIAKDIYSPKSQARVEWFVDFLKTYEMYLSEKDKKMIMSFVNYRKNLFNRIKLVLDPGFHGYNIKTTIGFKIRALLGRMY